jgi:uncharacterized protein (DUF1330 family)
MTVDIGIPEGFKRCECSTNCPEIIHIKDRRGTPRRFKSGHNKKGDRRGEKNSAWKGGRKKDHGYWLVYSPDHPNRQCNNYVKEHRLVMEKYLGRFLTREEEIHHINGNKEDNRIENLILFSTKAEHTCYENDFKKWRK